MPRVSLVVCTLGRSRELFRLFDSLVHQSHKDFEVLVVDQNGDDRIRPVLDAGPWPFPVRHIRTPQDRGLSRARNVGLKHANARRIVFPDDDCWYPPWFLEKGMDLLASSKAACVTGRAAAEDGRDINGRFSPSPVWVDRDNVWTTQIEWVAFFDRDALLAVGGYDEEIGVGAASPWGANEGQDITLRMLAAGFATFYSPALYGFHAEISTVAPTDAVVKKGRSYGRGFGYVLRRHGYGAFDLGYWLLRPVGGSALCLLQGNWRRARYYLNVALGRLEGWIGRRTLAEG